MATASSRQPFVPVLGYHRIVTGIGESRYDFSRETFTQHLDLFAQEGVPAIHAATDFIPNQVGRRDGVMLTFDDGYASDFHVVLPLLERYGFRATFFVTVGRVGMPGYVSWDEIRALSQSGMSIQSHSFDHLFLPTLDRPALLDQLKRSKDRIEAEIGRRVVFLAAPGGRVSSDVMEAAGSAGYRGVFTSEPGYHCEHRRDGVIVFRRFIMKRDSLSRLRRIVRGSRLLEYEERASYSVKVALRTLLGRP